MRIDKPTDFELSPLWLIVNVSIFFVLALLLSYQTTVAVLGN